MALKSIGLALALVGVMGAHLFIVVALIRRREPLRAAIAMVLPPLAPAWALERGMRAAALTWLGAFILYAVLVAAS